MNWQNTTFFEVQTVKHMVKHILKGECREMKDNKIIVLKGPDRVRKRPAVIFCSSDAEGAFHAFSTFMDVLVREAILGYSKKISVAIHDDGSITIRNDDRGMILNEEIINSKPAWQNIFCDFGVGPREPDEGYYDLLAKHQDTLYGDGTEFPDYPIASDYAFDLCCVQYVCKYMTVETVRDGVRKIVSFKKGYPVSDLEKAFTDELPGTTVHLKFDSEVFTETKIDIELMRRYLQVLAITIRGLRCDFIVDELAVTYSYQYPNGISDYIPNECFHFKEKEATGRDRYNRPEYKARVRIAVGFDQYAARSECFHNYRELGHGGAHLDAVKHKIKRELEWRGLHDDLNEEDSEKLVDTLMNHLVIVLETNCPINITRWVNGTRTAIENAMLSDIAADLIDDDFLYFLKQNKDDVLRLALNNREEK